LENSGRNSNISFDSTSFTIPRLSKRSLAMQIVGRWIRLAIPFYMVLGFTVTLYPLMQ
jgi:hypothetical protein